MPPTKPKQQNYGVTVAWIHPGQMASGFMDSVLSLVVYELERGKHLNRGTPYMSMQSSPRIAEARSQIVDHFLQTNSEWLFMVDADMTFDQDVINQMLSVAHPQRVPVLGGLCFAGGRGPTMYPTLYRKTTEGGSWGMEPVKDYPKDALVKVFATGAAALLIHRSVFTKMLDAYGTLPDGRRNPYPWFVEGTVAPNGRPLGEDTSFCVRLEPLDIPVHVHTGIQFGHIKTYELNEALWRERCGDHQ